VGLEAHTTFLTSAAWTGAALIRTAVAKAARLMKAAFLGAACGKGRGEGGYESELVKCALSEEV